MTDHMEAAAALLRASRTGKVSMADIERRWSGVPDVRMATRPWADYGDEDPGAGSLADVGARVARCDVWQTGGMAVEDMRAGDAPMRLDDVVFRVRSMSKEEAEKKEQLRRYVAKIREETEARETDSPLMDAVDDVGWRGVADVGQSGGFVAVEVSAHRVGITTSAGYEACRAEVSHEDAIAVARGILEGLGES